MAVTGNPFPGSFSSVTWAESLGLFAAAGVPSGALAVATSPNAQCWTLGTPPPDMTQGGIGWSPDLAQFVMAGQTTKTIATSTDGVTWTERTSPLDGGSASGVPCWSPALGLWAVGGRVADGSKCIITSPDGVTWTARSTPFDGAGTPVSNGVTAIAWSADLGLFVAVGVRDGTGADTVLATSADGVTWTAQTTPLDDSSIAPQSVAWSSAIGLFVVTGGLGTITSPDGVTWTLQTFTGSTLSSGVSAVDALGLLFLTSISGGFSGFSWLATSTDGVFWTPQFTPGPVGGVVTWAAALGLAIVAMNGAFATSPDGVNWTQNDCSAGIPAAIRVFPV